MQDLVSFQPHKLEFCEQRLAFIRWEVEQDRVMDVVSVTVREACLRRGLCRGTRLVGITASCAAELSDFARNRRPQGAAEGC